MILLTDPVDLKLPGTGCRGDLEIFQAGVGCQTVLHGVEQHPGEVHAGSMRQVAAVIEAHTENRVAGFQQRQVDRCVRLRPRVRDEPHLSRARGIDRAQARSARGEDTADR